MAVTGLWWQEALAPSIVPAKQVVLAASQEEKHF
jgi:hypothetical protein